MEVAMKQPVRPIPALSVKNMILDRNKEKQYNIDEKNIFDI